MIKKRKQLSAEELPSFIASLARTAKKAHEQKIPTAWKIDLELKRARGQLRYQRAYARRAA